MKTIKCGVIGLGRIGKIHLKNLVKGIEGVEVVAAVDVIKQGRDFASDLGVKEVYENANEVIDHIDIEAVVLCSPTDTHAEHIKRAAFNGKAIFCEKSLDLSLKTVHEVLKIVERKGIPLMVAFNRRFDTDFKKIHDLVKSGKIGNPHILKITSRDPGPPPINILKSSGGMFLDMTIHDFDMARYIMGCEVTEVYAKAAVLAHPEIGEVGDVDTAIVNLTFENGAMGVIDNSRSSAYGYDQRIEVFGSMGMVNIDNNHLDNHKYYNKEGVSQSLPLNFFMDRYINAYYDEMQAFIDALKNGDPMPVSGRDGLMSLVIGMAAAKSVKEGRPVLLNEFIEVGI